MQIDCGRLSELLVTGVNSAGSFRYDGFVYYFIPPATVRIQCSGVHEVELRSGDTYFLNPSSDAVFGLNSSVGVLNNSLETMALGPDTYLFFMGVVLALAFIAGVKSRV